MTDDDDVRPDPIEPPGGQEAEPPDFLLAAIAAIHLLRDVRGRLERDHAEHLDDVEAAELLLRIGAVVAVLRRVRDRLEDGGT